MGIPSQNSHVLYSSAQYLGTTERWPIFARFSLYYGGGSTFPTHHRCLSPPRVVYSKPSKRKRGKAPATTPSTRQPRPTSRRFDLEEAQQQAGSRLKVLYNHDKVLVGYEFDRIRYDRDGYLVWIDIDTNRYHRMDVVNYSRDELDKFRACRLVPRDVLTRSFRRADASAIRVGDRIQALYQPGHEHPGTVESITGDQAIISLSNLGISTSSHISLLRKVFKIGDEVLVKAGPHIDLRGLVCGTGISVDGEEQIIWVMDHTDPQTGYIQQVSAFHAEFATPSVMADPRLRWQDSNFDQSTSSTNENRDLPIKFTRDTLGRVVPNTKIDHSGVAVHINADLFRRLRGVHVHVVNGTLKGLEGVIKDVNSNGIAKLEPTVKLINSARLEDVPLSALHVWRYVFGNSFLLFVLIVLF